jgi:subtilisin family serine protease
VNANIPVVIAAGNMDQDASLTSPSDVKEAIVVGATSITDTKADFSNFGANVDIFAPGMYLPRSIVEKSDLDLS